MKKQEMLKWFLIAGILLIAIAFLIWIELSFFLGGLGIMVIGIGFIVYINRKE